MKTLMKDLGDLSGLDITAPDRTMSSAALPPWETGADARPARTWGETLRALRTRLIARSGGGAVGDARCRDAAP